MISFITEVSLIVMPNMEKPLLKKDNYYHCHQCTFAALLSAKYGLEVFL